MNSKNLFIFNSLVCILFGIPLLLIPDTMISQYTLPGDEFNNLGRILCKAYGGMLVTFGIALWLGRKVQNPSLGRTAFLWAALIGNLLAMYVWISSVLAGQLNNMIWTSIIIISVTALWAALLLFKKTD